MVNNNKCSGQQSGLEGEKEMKAPVSSDVIQGDEHCRDGHYRAKQDLRGQTESAHPVTLDPNDSTSIQAQNPLTFGELRIGPASEDAAGIPAIWNTMLYGI